MSKSPFLNKLLTGIADSEARDLAALQTMVRRFIERSPDLYMLVETTTVPLYVMRRAEIGEFIRECAFEEWHGSTFLSEDADGWIISDVLPELDRGRSAKDMAEMLAGTMIQVNAYITRPALVDGVEAYPFRESGLVRVLSIARDTVKHLPSWQTPPAPVLVAEEKPSAEASRKRRRP